MQLWKRIKRFMGASNQGGQKLDNGENEEIRFWCDQCSMRYVALTSQAGRKGYCKKCGQVLIIPKK
jgi:RNase P subunit RPR2